MVSLTTIASLSGTPWPQPLILVIKKKKKTSKRKDNDTSCDKLQNQKIQWLDNIQFIKISIISWPKLIILTGIFRITRLVSPQLTSVKIVQKINYIRINFGIEFLMSIIWKSNVKSDSDIINFLNNFNACWLWWNCDNNSKNSYQNHQFWSQNFRYFDKLNWPIHCNCNSWYVSSLPS